MNAPLDETERRVLGVLLQSPATFDAVYHEHGLRSSDFASPRYRAVFAGMEKLDAAVGTYDRETLLVEISVTSRAMSRDNALAVLDEINPGINPVPMAGAIRQYVADLQEAATTRGLTVLQGEMHTAITGGSPADAVLRLVESATEKLGRSRRGKGWAHIGTVLHRVQDRFYALSVEGGREVTGVPSGFFDLDAITGGFQPSKLYVVGARPAMGKSAFVTNIGEYAALHGYGVGMFSLEMEEDEVGTRLMSSVTNVPAQDLQRGRVAEHRWGAIVQANAALANAPLYVYDEGALSIRDVAARARELHKRLARKGGLKLVVVDYLGLMRAASVENRAVALDQISQALKNLAKELELPVIALAQLNRNVESRGARAEDKRPQMSDLKESGGIEQNADVVMLLFREEYYDPETERKGLADVIVAKHRGGPLGDVVLRYRGSRYRFENLGAAA